MSDTRESKATKPKRRIDLWVEDQGTLFLFTPKTTACRLWFEESVDCPPYMRLGASAAVEHRYARPIIQGARAAGLHVVVARGA